MTVSCQRRQSVSVVPVTVTGITSIIVVTTVIPVIVILVILLLLGPCCAVFSYVMCLFI